jgi:mRNA-degrading endonuclease YafQ of YafQ-DinJ toxin-antitoxin module
MGIYHPSQVGKGRRWRVLEHRANAGKVIDRAPKQVQEKYEFWRQMMESHGPEAVRTFPGFRDHALRGAWEGSRSSYLNDQYRVIYRLEREAVTVVVEKIGPHDY